MPKSRTRSGSSKNVAASSSSKAPLPLLDSLRAQMQLSTVQDNDTKSDTDNSEVLTAGWQCDVDDWSEKKTSNTGPDMFPASLRSIERKHEQAKNKIFQFPQRTIIENKSPVKEQIDDRTNGTSIDVSGLSSIVTDLITGQRDQSAYTDFLSILQRFSVRSSRDDNLEETVYHLIQAAVSFIRANEERFDPLQLEECYRRRHILKIDSAH
jgi:hypothetical protein